MIEVVLTDWSCSMRVEWHTLSAAHIPNESSDADLDRSITVRFEQGPVGMAGDALSCEHPQLEAGRVEASPLAMEL